MKSKRIAERCRDHSKDTVLNCWTISTSTVIKSADIDRREIKPDRLTRQTSEYINARGNLLLVRNLLNDFIEHIDGSVPF